VSTTEINFAPGNWLVFQSWNGTPFYRFVMNVSQAGVITIPGGYLGIICQPPQPNLVGMAIGNSTQGSITSYEGCSNGQVMYGVMAGTQKNGAVFHGRWYAVHQTISDAPEQAFGIGE